MHAFIYFETKYLLVPLTSTHSSLEHVTSTQIRHFDKSFQHIKDSTRYRLVLKWLIEVTDLGAEKEWPLYGSGVWKWGVLISSWNIFAFKNKLTLFLQNRIASPLSTSTPVSKELPSVISITESEVTNREKLKRQVNFDLKIKESRKQVFFVIFKIKIKLDFPAQRDTAVSLTDGDVDESENKYARRKPVGFIGKLMKAHEIHPKYKVNFKLKIKLRILSKNWF